jgi:hypothetical protein
MRRASWCLSENNKPELSHGLTRQNMSEECHRLNILAHHILAQFSPISNEGKKMMGKNIIEIFEQVNLHNWPDSKALSNLRTDSC